MDIGNQGNGNRPADPAQLCGRGRIRHRDPHELAANRLQTFDLGNGGRGIPGIGIVIDWTETGAPPPMARFPTRIFRLSRRPFSGKILPPPKSC
jgi:hypothetical protein